jgi:hypothetical protein
MNFRRDLMPKKSFIPIILTILLLLLWGVFFSCTTTPPARNDSEMPGENAEAEDDAAAYAGDADDRGGEAPEDSESGGGLPSGGEPAAADPSPADEIPDVDLPPREEPAEAAGELEEPFVDLPDTTEALRPPGETPYAGLEEPAAPALSEVPETLQNIEEVPSGSTTPPAGAVPPSEPPPPPPPSEPAPESGGEPPAPPPFIRPPEEAAPPREREPVPVPENPLPDLPALPPPPAAPEEELVFSRVVRATAGQLVEIPFRGEGWVYLGELSSRRGLAYDSRKLDPEGQSFVFRCETPGSYVLKFYRQDFIRDYILNDHVQVIVGEAPESAGIGLFNPPVDRGRVIAEPRWPPLDREREELSRLRPPQDEAETQAENEDAAARTATPETPDEAAADEASTPVETAGGTVPASGGSEETAADDRPEDSLPGGYLDRALEEYNAGRIVQALAIMDGFRQRFPSGSDEAWWLLGQLLEANSPARDINLSLEYYRRLVREFPQSRRVPAAQRRIAYLERFYFKIQ